MVRFVLLSMPRSGTSWVIERLSAHPAIGAYGELLLAGRTGYPTWPPGAGDRPFFETYLEARGVPGSRLQRHLHLFEFLDYLFAPRHDRAAVGFKLMYRSAAPYPELLAYFRRRAVRVLHLIRANLLDVALSQASLAFRNSAHAWSPAERDEIRVPVDTGDLLHTLRSFERDRALARVLLRSARVRVHEIAYEDLLVSDGYLHEALEFLKVPTPSAYSLSARMLKLAPASHRAGIANYDAVDACLRGTRFHRFLRPD